MDVCGKLRITTHILDVAHRQLRGWLPHQEKIWRGFNVPIMRNEVLDIGVVSSLTHIAKQAAGVLRRVGHKSGGEMQKSYTAAATWKSA